MITLSTTDRGFVSVDSWDEIKSLPGFAGKLNPKDKTLKEVIGQYTFPDYISCGLSTCGTAHKSGYIVTTESGEVTNIGNKCGKNYFGLDFDQSARAYDRAVKNHQNREVVSHFKSSLESQIVNVVELKNSVAGAAWVQRSTQSILQKNDSFSSSLRSIISNMIKQRDDSIKVSRQATLEEVKNLEASTGKKPPSPHYIEEQIGKLRGFAALYDENNLRKLLTLDLELSLKNLNSIDIESLSPTELSKWAKWCNEYEGNLSQTKKAIELGRELLQPENLSQLTPLIKSDTEKKKFKQWIRSTCKDNILRAKEPSEA